MVRPLIYICCLLTLWVVAEENSSKVAYFEYVKKYPQLVTPIGSAEQGEIEIVLDEEKIASIEQEKGRKVGVIADDSYWLWINDAVKFPSGSYGVYGRIIQKQSFSKVVGVAVMPILPDGRIALNRNFRHATRSWEYELPRGGSNPEETIEDVARREVKEETGMILDCFHILGYMAVDSGLMGTVAPVILAKVVAQEESSPEDSEAIAAIDAFSVEEIKEGLVKGYLCAQVNGAIVKIPLRDPFLAFALLQAELQHLLPDKENN